MQQDSTFRRIDEAGTTMVALEFEGQPVTARAGDNVAAALLAAGHLTLRTTPVSGAPRAPFCMMGACFDCLVEIDGEANRQALDDPGRRGDEGAPDGGRTTTSAGRCQ